MRTRIGKFEIIRRLGEGAMGEVFLGRDPIIGREVAVKTIRPQVATGEEARERFYREARAAGTLNHPNLVTVHEFGEDDGVLFLAMEYVPGEDLQVLLQNHQLTRPQILEILAQVCDGLAYAHSRGIMHRDIKPSNIRVDWHQGRPFVKVMDFGIARIAGSDMTGSGTILGTFGYMAPEYIQTGIPDPRADIFACGVILYEALAGERPFAGDTTATVLYRIVHEDPKPLDPARLHGISPAVQGILDQALVKDPALRYQRPEVMAAALRSAKDPDWKGGVSLGTTSSISRPNTKEAATTTAVAPTRMPTTLKANAPMPARPSSARPFFWAAGFLALAGLAAGSWVVWRRPASAGESASPLAQKSVEPETSPLPPGPPASPAKVEPPAETKPPVLEGERKGLPESPPSLAGPLSPLDPTNPTNPTRPAEPPTSEPWPMRPQRQRVGKAELQEGRGEIENHPGKAHQYFQDVQRQDPQNAKAYALDLVALYEMGRYGEMKEVIQKAKANGVNPRAFRTYPRYRMMLEEETHAHRIPAALREHFKAMRD